MERYFCVVEGKEVFKMVSPVYKQNIYAGVLDSLPPYDTVQMQLESIEDWGSVLGELGYFGFKGPLLLHRP